MTSRRLVLDGRIVIPRMTGAGRYVLELARRLRPMADDLAVDILLLPRMRATPVPEMLGAAGVTVHYVDAVLTSVRQWLLVPRVLDRLQPDLYHYPFVNLPFVRFPAVITVYDLNPLQHPAYFSRLRPIKRYLARRLLASSLRRCRAALAISEATRDVVVAQYPAFASKVRAVPLGVDAGAWSAEPPGCLGAEGEDGQEPWRLRPYVLYVGVDRPHKNLERLVGAFGRFRATGGWRAGMGPYLRLAGVGQGSTGLRGQVTTRGLEADVRLEGEVDEVALRRVYRHATVMAYVSTSEGFGLPILEAFGAGVPVVAAQASSLPEVGGDAAVYADPDDEAGIAAALTRVWADDALRRALVERGRRRVEMFSWDATTKATLAAYYDVLR